MIKSPLFSALNDIDFAQKDPDTITHEVISRYESAANRTLAASDPVRVFLDSVILAIIQQRNIIDFAAKQNLLAYATGDYLAHLGALLSVYRLVPEYSSVTIEFSLSEPQEFDVVIPAGTRITPDSNIYFAVPKEYVIEKGLSKIEIVCVCTTSGTSGNGFVPGQINKLVDVFPYEMHAINIDTSNGGTDAESDEHLRERIMLAPESFTNAGSINAYKYYTLTAHSSIIDAAILTPPDTEPGHVDIYPLCSQGSLPSSEIMQLVYDTCNGSDIRPDTDYVTVKSPVQVQYDIITNYYIDKYNSAAAEPICARVDNAINDFVLWQKSALGRDINPSELTHRIIRAGAKRCVINRPSFLKLKPFQVAHVASVDVVYSGLEDK